jgi:YebC/PmpR family DNA-binding regulatory protein
MSGHSKWHTIKHKKGAADAKRGKVFTRLIKELTVAARSGGGDVDMNPRLRTIVNEAKANNMPRENIERAIRRGTGEEPGVSYEEIMYEGYGPGGVALLIQTLTDNKNRTVGEIRHMLAKYNGNLAAENSVAWMFSRKGQIFVNKGRVDEDKLLSAALDAGADDMNDDESAWEIVTAPESFEAVRDAVKGLGIEPASAEIAMVPQNYVKLQGKDANQMIKLMEALDDHDDVQNVWANFDIEEKEIEASLA